jgi:hypothetical protein
MTLIRRKIEVEFRIDEGTFENSDSNTVLVKDLRVQANISNTDGPAMGQAQLRIFGLPPQILNTMQGLNRAAQVVRNNKVFIYAGEEGEVLPIIFQGTISLAQIDLANPPDSSLTVNAFGGYFEAIKTADSTSYPGTASVVQIMSDFAYRMGLDFDGPNGVTGSLSTPNFSGTLRDQAQSCADAAKIAWTIEDGKLVIWNRKTGRDGRIFLISPETGLIGYPSYSTGQFQTLAVTSLFNAQLRIGKKAQVESSLKVANGLWGIYNLSHSIESETPNGKWFTQFNGSPY